MAPALSAPFAGRQLVVDNSAFVRAGHPAIWDEWVAALETGQLYKTPLLEFEVLYSARNATEYAALKEELQAFRSLELGPLIVEAALAAQSNLAEKHPGFHRLPHPDYLIAATAVANKLAVLHYDGDYDRIQANSLLDFESVWLAPGGTLDDRPRDPLRRHRQTVNLGLGQFAGERAREVLEQVLDLIERELRADDLPLPARP